MKRKVSILLVSFLICGLFLTNCSQGQFYGWTPPVEGLQWGMSKAEVMDALKLTNDDIDTPADDSALHFMPKKEYELFGVMMTVRFLFQAPEDAFTGIRVLVNEGDLDVVEKAITEKLGEGQYSYSYEESFLKQTVISVRWDDVLFEGQPELINRVKEIYDSYGNDVYDDRARQLANSPLVYYVLNRNETSPSYGLLEIYGGYAAMLNYPEKFSKKK